MQINNFKSGIIYRHNSGWLFKCFRVGDEIYLVGPDLRIYYYVSKDVFFKSAFKPQDPEYLYLHDF